MKIAKEIDGTLSHIINSIKMLEKEGLIKNITLDKKRKYY